MRHDIYEFLFLVYRPIFPQKGCIYTLIHSHPTVPVEINFDATYDLGVHFMISVPSSTYAYEIRTHNLYFIYCYGLCCYVDYDIFFVTLNQYFFP